MLVDTSGVTFAEGDVKCKDTRGSIRRHLQKRESVIVRDIIFEKCIVINVHRWKKRHVAPDFWKCFFKRASVAEARKENGCILRIYRG